MSDQSHHPPKLEYQPALPIPLGKTFVWLFLSTEIMFFAGLIGTYIVLRFGAVAWPKPHDVHLSEPIGAFNTFVLICSSVSIVLAFEAAKRNRASEAKGWILVTFLLGCVFLGVKGYEYQAKFAHGLYPQQPHGLIYEKADIHYSAAVRKRLLELRAEMRLPGEATLTFQVAPTAEAGCTLTQTARFKPRGLAGLAYWYAVAPLHGIVFKGILHGIRRAAEANALSAASDKNPC